MNFVFKWHATVDILNKQCLILHVFFVCLANIIVQETVSGRVEC